MENEEWRRLLHEAVDAIEPEHRFVAYVCLDMIRDPLQEGPPGWPADYFRYCDIMRRAIIEMLTQAGYPPPREGPRLVKGDDELPVRG